MSWTREIVERHAVFGGVDTGRTMMLPPTRLIAPATR
jgi:hypothetical protein